MPRKRNAVARKPKTVYIPEDIHYKIDLLLMDPVLGKPKHGAWSDLVNLLLREYLARKIKETSNHANQERQEEPRGSHPSGSPRPSGLPDPREQPPRGISPSPFEASRAGTSPSSKLGELLRQPDQPHNPVPGVPEGKEK